MTAPFLSLAQIRNRLALTARDVIDTAEEAQQRSAATHPAGSRLNRPRRS
ncbi:hypothetical protein ABUL04_00285 [Micromonospora harpali]|uniref:Uncharacterized protein n=1 Tax=Micromonospora harpali TaxID=1490225 RepID=A0ABW1HMB0_9ACTN